VCWARLPPRTAAVVTDRVIADRPSLTTDDLRPVWEAVRQRLERRGVDNRGRVRLPDLPSTARLTLQALVGRRVGATVDLVALEQGLRALRVGDDLSGALAALGHPVSDASARRRAERRLAAAARDAAREGWPEPWRGDWIDGLIRAGGLRGLDPGAGVELVRTVLDELDALDQLDARADAAPSRTGPVSRIDLAARLFGSAHALDTGTRVEAAATRALGHREGPPTPATCGSGPAPTSISRPARR